VKQQPGSEGVVEGVEKDKFAIGYSGLGLKTGGVRTVPVAVYDGRKCFDTSAACTITLHLSKQKAGSTA
jgi:phosphate transport system substrate-binding protein